jgi:hypothetical protein
MYGLKESRMELVHIGDEIASRTIEWTDSSGHTSEVRMRVGRPQPFPDSADVYCPIQVIGVGSERVMYAAGIDGIQAISLALKMLRTELDALQRELGGRLTWLNATALDLD